MVILSMINNTVNDCKKPLLFADQVFLPNHIFLPLDDIQRHTVLALSSPVQLYTNTHLWWGGGTAKLGKVLDKTRLNCDYKDAILPKYVSL